MNHHDLVLKLAVLADIDPTDLTEQQLEPILQSLAAMVEIRREQIPQVDGQGDANRWGFGILKFREQRFYSVKLGNLSRERLAALGFGGAMLTSGVTLTNLVAAGALMSWPGVGALVAIVLALTGRAKPLVTSFGLDEAVTLDLAWREAKVEYGFRLVDVETLAARVSNVEAEYGNAGFSRAKLINALRKLEAIGMIKRSGGDNYQLTEKLRFSDADQLNLQPA